jgi:small-conductance mechanosensitive channel
MPSLEEILSLPIFANSLFDWAVALLTAFLSFVVLLAARKVVARYHARFAQQNRQPLVLLPLLVLSRTATPFFVIVALFLGVQALDLGARAEKVAVSAITIAMFWQTGIWVSAIASAWIAHKRRQGVGADRAALGSLGIIGFIVDAAVWSFVALLTLENLGVDITALVAGLGIGGIAVALAVQNIFGDLFASLSITLDRPFVVGDFLSVGDVLGTVESIGIKSTRVRSLSGEQIVMPNADLLGSRVRNYGRMLQRRVVFATSVAFDTRVDALEQIPRMIRAIIEAQTDTRFDRSHFAKHGAGSLDFETVYYVNSPDYNRYMDIQQAINLELHAGLRKLGVELAYPTQKLLVANLPGANDSATNVRQANPV